MNVAYIYMLLMLSVVSLYSADKNIQQLSDIKTCPHIIVHEGISAVHTDIYTKLLSISRTLQEQVNDSGTPTPLTDKPYYSVNRNIELLQYIVNYMSADNSNTYLRTLSLIELVHLYQEADFWAVDTHILDTIRNYIIDQLRNANTLTWLLSSKENLSHFISACNPVTLDTLARALHAYTSNMLWYTTQTLTGHTNQVKTIAVHTDGTLFSGSYDNTIRVWKKNTQGIYYCMQILTDHTEWINSVAVHTDGTLFSGSDDKTIRVWKPDAQGIYKCVQTLIGHTDWVNTLAVHTDGTLFSGSDDNTIRVWKSSAQGIYHCVQTLTGCTQWIRSLAIHTDGTLFSGSWDNTIRVWKPLEEHLSLEQHLLFHWIYNMYQFNNNTQINTLPTHMMDTYDTLPQSIKNHIIQWYKPEHVPNNISTSIQEEKSITRKPPHLFSKIQFWTTAGILAGCTALGTYLYYKWFKK